MLNQTGGGRNRIVTGAGGQQNHVKIGRTHPRGHQGPLRRFHRQIRTGFSGTSHMSLADTGPFDNPLVRCGHHLFEVDIGQRLGRHVRSGPRDTGLHAGESSVDLACEKLSSISR